MFSRTSTLRAGARRLHTQANATRYARVNRAMVVSSSVILVGTVLWCTQRNKNVLHNDAVAQQQQVSPKGAPVALAQSSYTLESLVWGSNRGKTLILDENSPDIIRSPVVAQWLEGVALRDLAVQTDHAACIDARGDIYQWGKGHLGSEDLPKPHLTLANKNVVQIQLTKSRLYALSASGRIYTMEVEAAKQALRPGNPTPSSDPWWSTGWIWGEDETVDYVEVKPLKGLKRREKFKSIAVGDNHLLALTTSGRTFAHPINKNANTYGQLGIRKIEVPEPNPNVGQHKTRPIQLVPKSLGDKNSDVAEQEEWKTNETIRFCPFIFEIPSLVGVDVAQVAAGSRSSYVRTPSGRVLGWGANEYGQIGLGANVALDTITVPTEVVLWRMISPRLRSKCIDVSAGGDLTSFMVEMSEESGPPSVDVVMCGNGRWGGLGNNLFSSGQGLPIRARGIGNLTQYDEARKTIVPILPQAVSVSPSGHVITILNTSAGMNMGRDLYVWGKNQDSELGNGKKSSLPMPSQLNVGEERVMLQTKEGATVMDLQGRVWGRRVDVEQRALAGYNNSVVYWKIQN